MFSDEDDTDLGRADEVGAAARAKSPTDTDTDYM